MKKILLLEGPNLNLTGIREPQHYGKETIQSWLELTKKQYSECELVHIQSGDETQLIQEVQQAATQYQGIILNGGGYSHTSIALADAVRSCTIPVIEVHLSNIHHRETFRQAGYLAGAAKGTITGLGLQGYTLALHWLLTNN